jgi:hypothetical protein
LKINHKKPNRFAFTGESYAYFTQAAALFLLIGQKSLALLQYINKLLECLNLELE